MQILNMLPPAMGKAEELFMESNSDSKGGVSNFFQSLFETSDNEQLEEVSLQEWLLDGASLEDLLTFIEKQLEEGMTLEDIITGLGTEAIGKLEELLEVTHMEQDFEKEQVAVDLIATLEELSHETSGVSGDVVAGMGMVPQMIVSLKQVEPEGIIQEMRSVLRHIGSLLATYQQEGELNSGNSVKLTGLLEQWTMLLRQGKHADIDSMKMQHAMLDKEESELLDQLIQRYEKRSFYAGRNMYAEDANVTKKDVMSWLQQATENRAQHVTQSHHIQQGQQIPMTQVEQYVVHVENTGRVERVGSELVDKLSTMIRESQFINQRDGRLELNLMLQPKHLGNVTLKMMQIDGEMIIKMLVSSHVAKDMLEQNIHQLRHLFSPHQVAVERNESVTDEEFYFTDEEEQHEQEEQETREEGYEDRDRQESDGQDIDFETIFNQLSEEGDN